MTEGPPPDVALEALEAELASLPHVSAVRVVATRSGRITEVHLIAEGGKPPKQLVRDVQTLAQARFGIQIDHRVVSVVQFGDEIAVSGAAVKLSALSWTTEETRATCRVRLDAGGESHLGEASGAATSSGRHRLAAQAAVQALAAVAGRPVADVADLSVGEVGDHRVALAVVVLVTAGADERIVTGSAIVLGDDAEAVVRALLDAFNRGAGLV